MGMHEGIRYFLSFAGRILITSPRLVFLSVGECRQTTCCCAKRWCRYYLCDTEVLPFAATLPAIDSFTAMFRIGSGSRRLKPMYSGGNINTLVAHESFTILITLRS